LYNGKETTIKDVAIIFENYFQKKITFNATTKTGDPLNWKADVQALNAIGFQQVVNFEVAILEYINWFKLLHKNG
jgi:UDP-glucose 4-epimerase